jgi:hypothetical protein
MLGIWVWNGLKPEDYIYKIHDNDATFHISVVSMYISITTVEC